MKKQNDMTAKIAVGLSLITLLFLISLVLTSLIFYQETHKDCLQKCKKKFKLNIDNSWIACEEGCDESR